VGRLRLEDFINSAEERWLLRLLLLLFDPWGPWRRVCIARAGAPGSAGCHCSGIERVVEEEGDGERGERRGRSTPVTLWWYFQLAKELQRNGSDTIDT
jgi:hypothetical protein